MRNGERRDAVSESDFGFAWGFVNSLATAWHKSYATLLAVRKRDHIHSERHNYDIHTIDVAR